MVKSVVKKSPRKPPAVVPQNAQYDMFTSFLGDTKDLSNTIELWDAIPKYAVLPRQQNALRDEKGRLPVHEHRFQYNPTYADRPRPISCKVTVRPASIKDGEGGYTDYYPSTDEELIEEVIKKIFSDQHFGAHVPEKAESWVRFSLYMIQKELKSRGKTRSIDQIKRSLDILAYSVYEVELSNETRNLVYTNPILSDLTRTTRQDYLEDPSSMWCARLPALISKSVNELSYRQFNYGTLMKLSTPLARWFYRRLTHNYTQADLLGSYDILHSSVTRDSRLLNHPRMSRNIKDVCAALQELQDEEVLLAFNFDQRLQGRKIIDVYYHLNPSPNFVREVKAANARNRDDRKRLR